MITNQEKKNNNKAWIWALLALFLGSNALWFWKSGNQNTTIETQVAAIDEAAQAKLKLDQEYADALIKLEEMRGSNLELNKVIDAQKAQLSQQRAKIDDLIRNKKDLAAAKTQIAAMQNQVNQYLAEIQLLKNDKEKLAARVTEVEAQATQLTANVATLTEEKTNLNTQLNTTSKDLEDTKVREDNLKKVIKVDKVELIAINAKGEDVKKAKNADGFKISFKTSKNTFARGKETFFVQILSPQGVTLGNKIMKAKLNNDEEVAYSQSTDVSYNGSEQDVTATILFDDVKIEPKAQYEIRVYHRGEYVGGNNSKKLKKNMFG